jgi:transposase
MRYVGIDWATKFHDVSVVDEQGGREDSFRVTHDASGLQELLGRLEALGGPQGVRLGIESGAPLLLDQLLERGYTLFVINPRQADRFRDRHTMSGAKDDRLDAYVLADAVRTDGARLRALERDTPLTEEIRLRDRARTRKVRARAELCTQLRDALARYHVGLLSLDREMADPFFLAVLRACPEPGAVARLSAGRVTRLLDKHRIRVLDATQVLERLRSPALRSLPHVVEALRDEALDVAAQIELLSEQIDKLDEQLGELLGRHPDRDLLQSLPGIADGLSARVIAEGGDALARCEDSTSCQVLCGTAPVTRRSGKRSTGTVLLRRGCNRELQSALFQVARGSLGSSRWARACYDHLRAHGKRRNAALRALSNKWVKIMHAVLRSRRPYDEERHIASLIAAGVPWAPSRGAPEAA